MSACAPAHALVYALAYYILGCNACVQMSSVAVLHQGLGFAILTALGIQGIVAFWRHRERVTALAGDISPNRDRRRLLNPKVLHRSLGRALLVAAWVNIGVGLYMLFRGWGGATKSTATQLAIPAIILAALVLLAELWLVRARPLSLYKEHEAKMAKFDDLVAVAAEQKAKEIAAVDATLRDSSSWDTSSGTAGRSSGDGTIGSRLHNAKGSGRRAALGSLAHHFSPCSSLKSRDDSRETASTLAPVELNVPDSPRRTPDVGAVLRDAHDLGGETRSSSQRPSPLAPSASASLNRALSNRVLPTVDIGRVSHTSSHGALTRNTSSRSSFRDRDSLGSNIIKPPIIIYNNPTAGDVPPTDASTPQSPPPTSTKGFSPTPTRTTTTHDTITAPAAATAQALVSPRSPAGTGIGSLGHPTLLSPSRRLLGSPLHLTHGTQSSLPPIKSPAQNGTAAMGGAGAAHDGRWWERDSGDTTLRLSAPDSAWTTERPSAPEPERSSAPAAHTAPRPPADPSPPAPLRWAASRGPGGASPATTRGLRSIPEQRPHSPPRADSARRAADDCLGVSSTPPVHTSPSSIVSPRGVGGDMFGSPELRRVATTNSRPTIAVPGRALPSPGRSLAGGVGGAHA